MARLKVFRGNYDGSNYRLVATTSKPKAMMLLGRPNKRLFERDFKIIENKLDCVTALASPETVFTKTINYTHGADDTWHKLNNPTELTDV